MYIFVSIVFSPNEVAYAPFQKQISEHIYYIWLFLVVVG